MQTSPTSTNQKGFSLIELLIVIVIIGVVAAIAIPNYLHSRQAARTASAFSSLRVVHSAQIAYRARFNEFGDLTELKDAGTLTDPLIATGERGNYTFVINPATLNADNYELSATPSFASWPHYYIDGSGIIRSQIGAAATADSPPLS